MLPHCGSLGLPQRQARQQPYKRSMEQQEMFSEANGQIGSAETRYTNAALVGPSSYTAVSAAAGAKRFMGAPTASLLRKRFFKCFRPADEAASTTTSASTTISRWNLPAEPAGLHSAHAGKTPQFQNDRLAGHELPRRQHKHYSSSRLDRSSYANPTPPSSPSTQEEEAEEEHDFSFHFKPIDNSPPHDTEQASRWIQQHNLAKAQDLSKQLPHWQNYERARHSHQRY